SSLDQIGPIAKNYEDEKIIFDVILGKDEMDSTSIDFATQVLKGQTSKKPQRSDLGKPLGDGAKVVGIPKNYLSEGVDPEVLENFNQVIEKLKTKGYEVKEIDLPNLKYSLAVYYIIMPAEVSTNLSRLDGVRYGLHISGQGSTLGIQEGRTLPSNIFADFKKSRSEGFGAETRRRIILGTYVLSHGYYDAYYNKAWAVRHAIEKEFADIFQEVDFIVTPTVPSPAFKFGEKSDPLQMYLEDIFTVPANLAGVPAISIPTGFSKNNLPFGVQFTGPLFSDQSLFEIEKDLSSKVRP
ncbi:MAG: amidase family protein, partial [Patescibacteria group bacterium]